MNTKNWKMKSKELAVSLLEYDLGEGAKAFSTLRGGGLAEDSYSGFNITHYCGDRVENILKNREILCGQLGIDDDHLLLPRQTHGTKIRSIRDTFFKLPATERQLMLEDTDALITDVPHVCIGVSTADCIPVLLHDSLHHIIAAVHAGWRGTVRRIVEKTITAMRNEFSSVSENVRAIIGPGISQAAFEVGDEVYEEFSGAGFPMEEIAVRINGKWHPDLWVANFLMLEEAGLRFENIRVAGICTYRNYEKFFSARRLGIKSGRIYNGIMLT